MDNYFDSIGLIIALIIGIILCGVVIYINLPKEEPIIVMYNGTAPDDWVLPKGVTNIDYMVVVGGIPMNLTVSECGTGGYSPPGPNDATNVSEDKISFKLPDCGKGYMTLTVPAFRGYKPVPGELMSYAECWDTGIIYEEIMGDDGYSTYWRKSELNNKSP